jgi:hypothetical protein
MDNSKLTERSEQELRNETKIGKTVSKNIRVESRLKNMPKFLWKFATFTETTKTT